MSDVTLWDFDGIESHNIPNQAFKISEVGQNKAEAMQQIIADTCHLEYQAQGKWNGERLDGIVFSCVDSMEIRKNLLTKMKDGHFIETRMGVYHGQVYTINAKSRKERAWWRSHWVGDDIIEEKSACGTSLTIGSTANLLSSIASWQGIYVLRQEKKIARGINACVNPYIITEF